MYCGIHNHTEYSNLKLRDCIIRVPALIDKAIEYGFNGIAITDHECISGHIEALEYGDKIREKNPEFKVILGNEIYLIKQEEYKNAEKYFHFILLAKDAIGHRQIRELSSLAWERSYMERGQRRCPTFYEDFDSVIGENKGHLIASTACLGGALPVKILQKNAEYINWFLEWGINTFGEGNFFLEMQDSNDEEQRVVNEYIVQFSKQTGIPYIITQDAHYLNEEDLPIFDKFLNSKEEKDREVASFYSYTYVKPESKIKEILSYLPTEVVNKGIENTQLIYNQIEYFDIRRDTIVPECRTGNFKVQGLLSQWYEKYPFIRFYAEESPYEQDRYLIYLIEQGIKDKNFNFTEVEADRINTELDVLKHISDNLGQRISAYLNLVKTIVDIMWDISIIGVSRGSALCFLINYLIGITQANPLDYDIPYWRFLNKDRAELPDVDLDSDPNKTDEIVDRLREYFGQKRVLNCLTYKKESLKSAILTAARGLGINNDEAQALSAMVPVIRGQSYTLKDCIDGNEEKDYLPAPQLIESLKKYDRLYETVETIEGLKSGSGCHASALYVFNEDYVEQLAMMRTSSGIPVTCFDYHASDQCGCLKVDELRTDCIAKMMKCMELMLRYGVFEWQGSLRATYNKYLHPDVIDYSNPKMWDDMADGKIMNLFQFETQVGGVCIKRTRPQNVKELGAANAVMRLMPQEGQENPLDRYVRFRHNIQEWYDEMKEWGLTEEEVKVLEKHVLVKYGNAPEQEDMMLLVMDPAISGFSLKDSNKLRKGVAKKSSKIIAEMKEKFFGAADE